MNWAPPALCAFVVLVLLAAVAGVVAQKQAPDASQDVGKPVAESSCSKMAIEALRAAVDPGQADKQDWNLKASQAYQKLAELGQSC